MSYCEWAADNLPGPLPAMCAGPEAAAAATAGPGGGGAWSDIVRSFSESAAATVQALATGWLRLEGPALDGESGPIAFLFENTLWLTTWVAVVALLAAAGRMAWERRTAPAKEAMSALVRLVLASTTLVAVTGLLVQAGDEMSVWLVGRATGCGAATASDECVTAFTDRITALTELGTGDDGAPLALVLILAVLLIVASLAQIVFLLARNIALVALVGTLPLVAAASATPVGRIWFQKITAVLLALVLYKPAAAVVYSAAFASMGSAPRGELMTQISGVALLIVAGLTLPALLRVSGPAVQSTVAAVRGAGPAAAAAKSVATGAIAIKAAKAPAGGKRAPSADGATTGAGPAERRPGNARRAQGAGVKAAGLPRTAAGETGAEALTPSPVQAAPAAAGPSHAGQPAEQPAGQPARTGETDGHEERGARWR